MTDELESLDWGTVAWTAIDAALLRHDVQTSSRDYWLGCCVLDVMRRGLWAEAKASSLAAYFQGRLGWDPHTTRERQRTALALEKLPLISDALRTGRIRWTAAREISRVATPATEPGWIEDAQNMTTYSLALKVRQFNRGDDAKDRPRAENFCKTIHLRDCNADEYAIIRGAIRQKRHELGAESEEASDAAVLASILREGITSMQLEYTQCPTCQAAGVRLGADTIAVDPVEAELVACSERVIGVNGEVRSRRISKATERAVMIRAGYTCEFPGCRRRFFCSSHHVELWSEGGKHSAENLVCLCSLHHRLLHRGSLILEGSRKTGFTFLHADGTPIGKVPAFDRVKAFENAFAALRHARIEEGRIRDAFRAVRAEGTAATEEEIISAATEWLTRPEPAPSEDATAPPS